jgi:Clr5 domain
MDSTSNQEYWEAFMSPSNQEYSETFTPPTCFSKTPNDQPVQPQPHIYTISPVASKQAALREFIALDWDVQKTEIARLYENNTLGSVMKFMREQHGLDAT